MALTTIPSELSSVSGIADSSDATAITIDSSENVTLSSNMTMPGGSNITWGTSYPALGNIKNSQATLLGNNIKAGATNNTIIRHANGTDAGTFIGLTYNKGVTFHTGIATTQNSEVAETTNERMRIDATGKVGIGETSPTRFFVVKRSDSAGTVAEFENTGTSSYIQFTCNSQADNAAGYVGYNSDKDLSLWTNDVQRVTIDVDGYMGIGTTNPTRRLHIVSTGSATYSGSSAGSNIGLHLANLESGAAGRTIGIGMSSESNAEVYLNCVTASDNNGGDFVIASRNAGTRSEKLRIKADGTALFTQGSYAAEIHSHSWATSLETTTSDGSDNYAVGLDAGSGAGSNGRGAGIWCYGNENGSHPGAIVAQIGAAGVFKIFAGVSAAEALRIDASGHLLPGSDATKNLGSTSKRWDNLYVNDMHFSNEGSDGNDVDGTTGDWTLQEGEEHLYIINNKSGKKFKFSLEEVE